MSQLGIYEYHNNILSVAAWVIYADLNLFSERTYKRHISKMKIERTKRACPGQMAFVSWRSLSDDFKTAIKAKHGDPEKQVASIPFKEYLKADLKAIDFFRNYELEDGNYLPRDKQKEYCTNASLLNACGYIASSVLLKNKTIGKSTKVWVSFAEIIKDLDRVEYPHSLPAHPKDLKYKYQAFAKNKTTKKYNKAGYEGLIHGNYLNRNSQKLSADAKLFVLGCWANQVEKTVSATHLLELYNEKAEDQGWNKLISEKTLLNYLNKSTVKPLWEGHRYGEQIAKEKYAYQHTTKMPTMRDSLWYSDGTKLNYFYLDQNGKVATCQVYEVIDAYSEVLLGYHISNTENFDAQYSSYRMAIQMSGYKPYQIGFDGQGGHGKLVAGDFFKNIAEMAIKTTPYNGKSKTIESAFGRFQKQFLKRDWFFTGMNITAKSQESKINREFFLENQSNLPTLDEVKKVYAHRREQWNNAPHYATGQPRIEMYLNSTNPETKKIELWDMVNLFWVKKKEPVVCTAQGLSFTLKGTRYQYMVNIDPYTPNIEWLSQNVDNKFIVKYDPEDMTLIHLYEDTPNGLRFVNQAEPKIVTHRGKQEQEAHEAAYFKKVQAENNNLRVERRDTMEEILMQQGMSASQQGLNVARIKGIETSKSSSRRTKKGEVVVLTEKPISYAQALKEESNQSTIDAYNKY